MSKAQPEAGLRTFGHRGDWNTARFKYLFVRVQRPIRLSDGIVTAFRDGEVTLRSKRREEGFTMADKEIGYQGVEPGDLVVHQMDGFAGAIGVSDSRGKCSPVYTVAVPSDVDQVDVRFWAYYLRNLATSGFIQSLAKGIRERSTDFRWNDVANLLVNFPDLPTQKAIADFLDRETARIDQLIEKKQRLVELLGVRLEAGITKVVSGIGSECAIRAVDSTWYGTLPSDWTVRRLRDVAQSLQTGPFGSQLHSSDYVSNGIPVINPSHMASGRIVEDPLITVNQETAVMLGRYSLERDDIVFARRGDLGRCALVTAREAGWLCGTGSIRVRLKAEWVLPEYLMMILSTSGVREWLSLESVGSTMENLNSALLGRLPLPIPPLEVQRSLLRSLKKDRREVTVVLSSLQASIRLLEERKAALITEAVIGKFRLPCHDS